MASESEFNYTAFISYKHSHQDIRYANWLQKKLEHYRLPSKLCKEKNLPKSIRPVFLDRQDLASSPLEQTIREEIGKSKHLIVICSKAMAAKPQWIEKEIRYFWSFGHPERTIPIILDGIPNSADPVEECFPPSLLSMPDQPAGIHVKELGKSRSLIKIIASLLDVRYDILWGRERRRKVRNNIILAIICFIFIVVSALAINANEQRISIAENQRFSATLQSANKLLSDGWNQYSEDMVQQGYAALSPMNQAFYRDTVMNFHHKAYYQRQFSTVCGVLRINGINYNDIQDVLFSDDLLNVYVCFSKGFQKYSLYNGSLQMEYVTVANVEKHWIDADTGNLIAYDTLDGNPYVFDEASGQLNTTYIPNQPTSKIPSYMLDDYFPEIPLEKTQNGVLISDPKSGDQINVPLDLDAYSPCYDYCMLTPDGQYGLLTVELVGTHLSENGSDAVLCDYLMVFPLNEPQKQLIFSSYDEILYGFSSDSDRVLFAYENSPCLFNIVDLKHMTEWEVESTGVRALFMSDDLSIQCTLGDGFLYFHHEPENLILDVPSSVTGDDVLPATEIKKPSQKDELGIEYTSSLRTGLRSIIALDDGDTKQLVDKYCSGRYFLNTDDYGSCGETERYRFTKNYGDALEVFDKLDNVSMSIDEGLNGISYIGTVAVNATADKALIPIRWMGVGKADSICLLALNHKEHKLELLNEFQVGFSNYGVAFCADQLSFLVLQGESIEVYNLNDGHLQNRYYLETDQRKNSFSSIDNVYNVEYGVDEAFFDVAKDILIIHYEYNHSYQYDNIETADFCEIYRLSTGSYIADINVATQDFALDLSSYCCSIYNFDLGLLVVGNNGVVLAQVPILSVDEAMD